MKHSKMSNMLPNETMRRVIARLLQQQQRIFPDLGSATENTILTLVRVAQLYLNTLAHSAKRFAELSGRTKANAFDIAESLEEAHVDLADLFYFSQDPINVTLSDQNQTLPGCFLDKVMESPTEDSALYEFVDCIQGEAETDSSQTIPSPTLEPEDISDEYYLQPLSPLIDPEDELLKIFPKPNILPKIFDTNLEKTDESLVLNAETTLPDTGVNKKTPPLEKNDDVSKPTITETPNIWKALHQRRLQQRQKEVIDPPKLPSARHDETYRTSFQEIKRNPDCSQLSSESPFDVGSFAPDPPTGNRATVNHLVSSFQSPISKMFQESVLSSFLPKFVVSAPQGLDQEQISDLGHAPFPSWIPPPKPVRIVAKVFSPKIVPEKPATEPSTITRITATVSKPSSSRSKTGRFPHTSALKGPSKSFSSDLANPSRHLFKSSVSKHLGGFPKITAKIGSRPDYRSSHGHSKHSYDRHDINKSAQSSKPLILRIPSIHTNNNTNGNGGSNSFKLEPGLNHDNYNGHSNGSIQHNSSPSLSPLDKPILRITDPRKNNSIVPQDASQSYENSNAITNCVCANFDTDEGFMMECSFCTHWFHGICVGYSSEGETPDTWACPRCKEPSQGFSPVLSPADNSKRVYDPMLPNIIPHERKSKHKKHKHRKRDSIDNNFDHSHRRIHRTSSPYSMERNQRSPRW